MTFEDNKESAPSQPSAKKKAVDDLNNAYSQHCANVGHKERLIKKLEKEIRVHEMAMDDLDHQVKVINADGSPVTAAVSTDV